MNEVVIVDSEKLEIGSLVTIDSAPHILAAVFSNEGRYITFVRLDNR